MTGTGRAIVNTPARAHRAPTNIPTYVFGAISPEKEQKAFQYQEAATIHTFELRTVSDGSHCDNGPP